MRRATPTLLGCLLLAELFTCRAAFAQPGGDELAAALASVSETSARRAQLDAEIEGLGEERTAAQHRLRDRVRVLYRLRRAGVLPLAGGLHAVLRHQSRITRLERMVERDVTALGTLGQRVAALSFETARLAEELTLRERRAEALREAEAAQVDQLAVLNSMIEDPDSFAGPSTHGFGLRMADGTGGGGLVAQRGSLELPVGGSARVSDGVREGGEGLELFATPGVPVRSVAAGRVAYAAPHPAYQRLVIVDHGDGHFTVYGGLARIAVAVGQEVSPAVALGAAGEGPVFFQVRRGSRPLPARAWLGI